MCFARWAMEKARSKRAWKRSRAFRTTAMPCTRSVSPITFAPTTWPRENISRPSWRPVRSWRWGPKCARSLLRWKAALPSLQTSRTKPELAVGAIVIRLSRMAKQAKCYLCGRPAVWHVLLGGEDETPEDAAACEEHAHGHMREPIGSDWGLPNHIRGAHFEHTERMH